MAFRTQRDWHMPLADLTTNCYVVWFGVRTARFAYTHSYTNRCTIDATKLLVFGRGLARNIAIIPNEDR